MRAPVWRPPHKPSPWQRHFELLREAPGQWALVSEIRKGGCRARQKIINNDRTRIRDYLDRHHPLEHWTMRTITVAGTHCDRELWLRFDYYMSEEEAARYRWERQEDYQRRMAMGRERKKQREEAGQRKAQEDQAAARVAIQARRRPGQ